MLSVIAILALAALLCTIASWGWGKPALQLAVLLLCLIELLRILPVGR